MGYVRLVDCRSLSPAQPFTIRHDQLTKQRLFVVEIPVEEPFGDTGRVHDVDHPCLRIAPFGEENCGPIEKLLFAFEALGCEAAITGHDAAILAAT